jgi:hypothetical protein
MHKDIVVSFKDYKNLYESHENRQNKRAVLVL